MSSNYEAALEIKDGLGAIGEIPSLRDLFAMHALTGLLGPGWTKDDATGVEEIPKLAYLLADRMLEARQCSE